MSPLAPLRRLLCSCSLPLMLAACGGDTPAEGQGGSGGSPPTGVGGQGGAGGHPVEERATGVVVGLLNAPSEPFVEATRLRTTLKLDGATVREETWGDGAPAFIPFPMEFDLEAEVDGAEVEVVFERERADGALVQQVGRTRVVAGRKLLLRMTISDAPCAACDDGLTCSWGRCLDPAVSPEHLEDHTPDWASRSWCKPQAAGDPTLMLGKGESDFTPLAEGDVVQVWAGSQGGYHTFFGARMRHLRQSAVTTVHAEVPSLAATIGPFSAVSVFRDYQEAGYCETTGFLFRLDQPLTIDELLGQPMQVTATVSDADGSTQEVTQSVVIDTEILEF
ncbi:hypothetical protein [Chondromyces apiculatus]|uniref:Lipoprotein n=1 Tax=Chondromyces apiculatus DSM 436 TaxID=1192034 RepID=A0A017T659_9BACT|nr:hypothetical protein [Chondromyces apiculatus]EYF04758.1 Hypothetical protein CAP_4234 [Chondromyces apiculatus DSM 436]